jgi:hypothetical protein
VVATAALALCSLKRSFVSTAIVPNKGKSTWPAVYVEREDTQQTWCSNGAHSCIVFSHRSKCSGANCAASRSSILHELCAVSFGEFLIDHPAVQPMLHAAKLLGAKP